MTFEQAFADLMRAVPHAGKAPSVSFTAVLDALRYLGRSYALEVARMACVDVQHTSRLLARMHELGVARRAYEVGDRRTLGRALRVYYELTPEGRQLASLPRKAAA